MKAHKLDHSLSSVGKHAAYKHANDRLFGDPKHGLAIYHVVSRGIIFVVIVYDK
jgi:hypothetical protein